MCAYQEARNISFSKRISDVFRGYRKRPQTEIGLNTQYFGRNCIFIRLLFEITFYMKGVVKHFFHQQQGNVSYISYCFALYLFFFLYYLLYIFILRYVLYTWLLLYILYSEEYYYFPSSQ